MTFSYYKKYYKQNSNKPANKDNLEDICFTHLANIEQFKKYDEKPLTFPEIPFFAIYYFVDTLMRTGFKDSWLLYFPLTILAVINYFIVRQRKLKFKKYCLGQTVSTKPSQVEQLSDIYMNINNALLIISLPVHLWILLMHRINIGLDILMIIILSALIFGSVFESNKLPIR